MKIAYFDCFSGISGDMTLGALADLGVPEAFLLEELRKLPLEGYSVKIAREMRGAISGVRVIIEAGHQPSRHYQDIRKLVEESGLGDAVREKSLAIFERLARAESQVHQVPMSRIHFHEVGGVDSILDVVGAVIGLEWLGIEKVYASPIPLGRGFVRTHHGTIPIPAPATVMLLSGATVYDNGIERELTTPTGAAIVTAFAESYGPMPEMTLLSTGYGVGTNPASDPPNLLRIMVGESRAPLLEKRLLLAETNIDDMNPEFYNYVFEKLFALGVLDVALVPVQMKKNRPGVILRALFEPSLEKPALDLLFRETTSLGVRVQEVKRVELKREERFIDGPFGRVRMKCVTTLEGEERLIPEYEECRRIAEERNIPVRKVYEEILMSAVRS